MDTCREWKKTTKWKQLLTWECQEKDQGGDQEGDGWIVSEGICRHCGSPQRMPRTQHSGNQEFGPLTPPSGKRRKEEEGHGSPQSLNILRLNFGPITACLIHSLTTRTYVHISPWHYVHGITLSSIVLLVCSIYIYGPWWQDANVTRVPV